MKEIFTALRAIKAIRTRHFGGSGYGRHDCNQGGVLKVSSTCPPFVQVSCCMRHDTTLDDTALERTRHRVQPVKKVGKCSEQFVCDLA